MTRKFLYFFISILCLTSIAFAQEKRPPSLSIMTDSLFIGKNGVISAVTVVIENERESAFVGKISIEAIDGITLVGKEAISIHVDPSSKMYYPIRLLIGNSAPAGITPFVVQLLDYENSVQAAFNSKLVIEPKREIRLMPNRPIELMQNVGDSLSVSAQLRNNGNSTERITLTASFPNLTGGNKIESRTAVLRPFQDTIITFSEIITKELLAVEHYTVNIAALYDNGELINNVMVTVQNVSGNRSYKDTQNGYNFDSYSSNKIRLSGRNLFDDNEALQLTGGGTYQLLGGVLDFNLDAYHYTHNTSRPLLTNTYVNYELKNRGIIIGNISESLETFLNGRGIKIYTGNEEESKQIEVGIVDKSYSLLGDEYSLPGGRGYSVYAKTYLNNQSNQHYKGSILYDRSPLNSSESMILMNDYHYRLNDKLNLGFELGGGLTRMPSETSTHFKPSIAFGNKVNGVFGKYLISSHQFYSSGYYPGTRRGILQLNERLSRNFNKLNAWLAYSYYSYNPKYFESQYYSFTSKTANSWLEGGSIFPLSGRLNLSLSVKRQADQGRISYSAHLLNAIEKMTSLRITESMNWSSENNQHMIYFSSESGFASLPFAEKKQFQIRTTGTWSYRFLTVSSYFQQGDFSLVEAYSNAQQGGDDRYRFNLLGSFRKEFFNKKLKNQLDINYNRDSYSGDNWMFSGLMDYTISPIFSVFINAYIYAYNNSYFNSSYSNIQSGISYNLPKTKATKGSGKKSGNVKLLLFFDNNLNGVFDQGDTPAESRIVMIGGVSFITQADGTLVYRKVPYGSYDLSIPSESWYAGAPEKLVVQSGETNMSIPLKKMSKITGKFYYNYDKQTSEEFVEKYGGLRILVTDAEGFSSVSLSNANGEFTLFVPVGSYELEVDETSLPKQVFTIFDKQQINVLDNKTTVIPEVELKVIQRKIELKRFSSE